MNLYIDGVGQKGYVRSGVSGQAGDTQGNPFPQLAIGEYKVITSNYKAEYDQISSAAITALSRSGTNEFRVKRSARTRRTTTARKHAGRTRVGPQGRIREQGIRHRVRRTDHRGQTALLRDIRRQALSDSGHCGIDGSPPPDFADSCRRCARATRARAIDFKEDLLLRETRLGDVRLRFRCSFP